MRPRFKILDVWNRTDFRNRLGHGGPISVGIELSRNEFLYFVEEVYTRENVDPWFDWSDRLEKTEVAGK